MSLPVSANATLLLDPAAPIRRSALTAVLALSVLTGLLTLGFAVTPEWDTRDQVGLALLCGWNLALLVVLQLRPGWLRAIGYVYFAVGAVSGLAKFAWSILAGVPYFGPYAYWMPLSYLVAVLVLRPRQALLASLALYAGFVSVGVIFAFTSELPAQVKRGAVSGFVQFYLSHAVYLSVFAMLAHLIWQYLRSLVRAEAQAREAYQDQLTGLPNRRQLSQWLEEELLRARAFGQPFSVVVFDLDHFKRVNDTHGHAAGDAVLRATAATVREALRGDERFGRWGGEEFLVLLPRADLEAAQRVAERLREAVNQYPHAGVGVVTASFGVAQASAEDTAGSLFGRADAALYGAKRAGRARVWA